MISKHKEEQINEKIIKYYQDCDDSYQHWSRHEIYDMHYGYWDETVKNHGDSLLKMNQVVSEKMKIKSKDKILDAGCGVGAVSIWLAKRYSDIEVTGINISKMQIDKASSFAKKFGVENRVEFLERDFLNTSFADESFDVVFAIESVCHTEDKKDFIKEAYRILKVGGKLVIIDGFIKKEKLNKLNQYFLNNLLRGWVIPNLAKKSDFQKYLKESGFKNIEFTDITRNILSSSREIFKRGILGWPVYKLKRKKIMQINHVEGCIFQYLALKSGVWIYGVIYAEK